jgi:hypothetical protein
VTNFIDANLAVGERDVARGGGAAHDNGPFPCQSDITVGPYRVLVAVDTGEATIVYAPSRTHGSTWLTDDDEWDYLISGEGEVVQKRPKISDDERLSKNRERANKRARVALRRYCVKNRLQKMLTLTYADSVVDHRQVKDDVNALFVRWRSLKGDRAFPYAYVLELHPGGHGLHVHIAVPLHFIEKRWLEETWGHGFVNYRDPKFLRDRDKRECARRLSGYLAKYVAKDLGTSHEKHSHRYEVAQGFGVEIDRSSFRTLSEAIHWLSNYPGERFVQVWDSNEEVDWEGPPVKAFRSPEK